MGQKIEELQKDIRDEFRARRKGKSYGIDIPAANMKLRELRKRSAEQADA